MNEDAEKYLKMLFSVDEVFEIRIFINAGTFQAVRSGYFRLSDMAVIQAELGKLGDECSGVYCAVNPVKPELYSRVNGGKFTRAGRNDTTKDCDILEQRTLIIDCDPVRPSGIAATEAELAAAKEKRNAVRRELADLGMPEPLIVSSGNGCHLLYRVSPDCADLIKPALYAVSAKYSGGAAHIDTAVANPARILRLPGTWNRKGRNDLSAGRVWRKAEITAAPEVLTAADRTALEKVIAIAGTDAEAKQAQTPSQTKGAFDLEQWIAQYAPSAVDKGQIGNAHIWELPECPFNPEHKRSASISLHDDGKPGFRCLHNSCSQYKWQDFRALLEPGCYDAKKQQDEYDRMADAFAESCRQEQTDTRAAEPPQAAEAEISAEENDDDEELSPWQKITDDDARTAIQGTLIGELAGIFASAANPPLPLPIALAKALTLAGAVMSARADEPAIVARGTAAGISDLGDIGIKVNGADAARVRILTGGGQTCNFYTLVIAPSASGKDVGNLFPLAAADEGLNLGDSGSAEGLMDALLQTPNGILVISEMQNWLNVKHWQHSAVSFLTSVFTSGQFRMNLSKRSGNLQRESSYCFPSIAASVQPDIFRKITAASDQDNGFLGRFLFFNAEKTLCNPCNFSSLSALQKIKSILAVFRRKQCDVKFPDGYMLRLQEIFCLKYPAEADDKLFATWRRLANQYLPKIATALSVSDDGSQDIAVSDTAMQAAEILCLWLFKQAEGMLLAVGNTDEQHERLDKFCDYILDFVKDQKLRGHDYVTTQRIHIRFNKCRKSMPSSASERRDAIDELVSRGLLVKGQAEGRTCVMLA